MRYSVYNFEHDTFRSIVKHVLKMNGLTYKDLADMTGYSEGFIGAYMCGANNSGFLPIAVAEKLDIDLELKMWKGEKYGNS